MCVLFYFFIFHTYHRKNETSQMFIDFQNLSSGTVEISLVFITFLSINYGNDEISLIFIALLSINYGNVLQTNCA